MNFRVCESPWVKVYWYELEDLSELSDEELLRMARDAQRFYKLAIRANGDEEKLQTLVEGADTEQNVFLRAFCRSFDVAQEKARIYRENARKRWEKAKKEKEGAPNAEPAPLVNDAELIAPAPIDADYNPLGLKNPHGTYGKLFFARDEMDVFASVANSVKNPTAVVQAAINEISKSINLRSLHISEADRVDAVDRITKRIRYVTRQKNELAVAQAKLDTANVYKAAQDAKPKPFQ